MPPVAVRRTLAVLLAVTPLALINGLFLSHDVVPKVILIFTGAAVLFALLPQWGGLLADIRANRTGRWFLALMMAQMMSLLVSTIFSSQPLLSLAGTTWRRFGLLENAAVLVIALAVAGVAAGYPEWIPSLFRAIVVCAGVAAVYGILQYFGVDPFLDPSLYTLDYFGGVVRPPSTMGHAIYFAAYLVPVALIAASYASRDTSPAWRRVHATVAMLCCLAIVLSGSRGAVLAVMAGAIPLMLPLRKAFAVRAAAFAAGLVVVIAGIAVSPAGAGFRQRIEQWRQDPGGPRLRIWAESPRLIAEHPLLGTGPETFGAEFRRIQSAGLSRAYPDFYNETPHNALLDAACGQGIPGLLIVAGVFAFGWKVGREWRPALLGILVAAMFASFTLVASMFLWSISGAIAGLASSGSRASAPRRQRIFRVPAYFVAGMFLIAAACLAMQDGAYGDLRGYVMEKNLAGAEEAYARAERFSLRTPSYELWSSSQFASLGRSLGETPDGLRAWETAAAAAAIAARSGEETFSGAWQSSILALARADADGAETRAREAIRLAPNWYKPHVLLGQILGATGRMEESRQAFQSAQNLGANSPN